MKFYDIFSHFWYLISPLQTLLAINQLIKDFRPDSNTLQASHISKYMCVSPVKACGNSKLA